MIPKNTTVPTSKTQVFSTAADNQTSVEVHVVQGERPLAADNKTLGKFMLDGIPPSPRGLPQVEVSFDIDANGILSVKAMEKKTGKSQSIRIEASTALSKEEIERLKQEAAKYAEEDAKKRALIEARNHAETLAYSAEKAITEAGDKLPADIKSGVEAKISEVKRVKDGEDASAIESAVKELSEEMQKIGSSMYNNPNDPQHSGQEPQGDGGTPE
jgi:molecular chaperone DnaK